MKRKKSIRVLRATRLYKNSHKLLSNSSKNNLQSIDLRPIKVLIDNQDSMTKEEIVEHLTILNEYVEKYIKSSNQNNPVINLNTNMKLNYFGSKLEPNTSAKCYSILRKRARLKPNKKGKNRVRFNDSKKRSLESD